MSRSIARGMEHPSNFVKGHANTNHGEEGDEKKAAGSKSAAENVALTWFWVLQDLFCASADDRDVAMIEMWLWVLQVFSAAADDRDGAFEPGSGPSWVCSMLYIQILRTLDASLLQTLQSTCPEDDADSDTKLSPLDSVTANKFDNIYYKNFVNNYGLLQSDQALMRDNKTASIVINYSKLRYLFYRDFAASMMKMANIGVLTGQSGEIRKNYRVVN
ncbi:uncharacterized protein LOC121255246 [Juglans microcarpa x Juglans regia]|uniref:uncharacterized protein LOC121255246 n=1 Tax=Juglans microcarpa x Juglans regia TaxID=2249226 RepID=UPI001B7E2137|nr:uncharacterized protein LOC121255246 [Juglans microcarpa x Juglans regia]